MSKIAEAAAAKRQEAIDAHQAKEDAEKRQHAYEDECVEKICLLAFDTLKQLEEDGLTVFIDTQVRVYHPTKGEVLIVRAYKEWQERCQSKGVSYGGYYDYKWRLSSPWEKYGDGYGVCGHRHRCQRHYLDTNAAEPGFATIEAEGSKAVENLEECLTTFFTNHPGLLEIDD